MPRNMKAPRRARSAGRSKLVEALADELKAGRESGQPVIEEEHFKTGLIRVSVIWDRWEGIDHEDRTSTILRAYELAEGPEYAGKVTLAGGQTFPEAHASGMLPFQVMPFLRAGDPVTMQECWRAMIEEEASTLFDPDRPRLLFSTGDDAEACRKRLAARLPESEPVWQILEDVAPHRHPMD